MRAAILKRAGRAFGQAHFIPQSRGVIIMVAFLLAAASLFASPVVNTLGGGNPNAKPKYLGYQDGITLNQALFHTPCGIALDSTGQYLFVADRDNNAIRYLDLVAGWTWTFDVTYTNLINKPIAVAVDTYDYVYVLNRGNVTNGSVVTFDNWGDAVATNAVRLTNAAGMALDSSGNIYVTVNSNKLIKISPFITITNVSTVTNITVSSTNVVTTTNITTITTAATNRTTIATIPNTGTSLQGIVVKHNGLIAACDSGRNGIYLINPATGVVTTNAGFHGTGDFTTNGNNIASSTKAMFNQPMCVAEAGDGTLIVTDYGNNRVKAVLTSGVVTNLYGVTLKYWGGFYPGWYDGTVSVPDSVAPNVQSRLPFGVAMASDGSFYTTEDYYHLIRKVTGAGLPLPPPPPPNAPTILTVTTNYGQVSLTWSTVAGATSYNVKRSQSTNGPFTTIASTPSTSYTDTSVINGTTYYYVVTASNTGGESPNSAEVNATPPLPPVPDPQIGYVDFPATSTPIAYTSVFHPVSSYDFYNDALIVIKGTAGSGTYYAVGYTNNASAVPDPTTNSPSINSGYEDGLSYSVVSNNYTISQTAPYLIVKAMGAEEGGYPNSAVVESAFQFITGNPNISGANAAQFTISDITANAHLYYTLDGSDPSSTNPTAIDLGTSSNDVWTVSFSIQTNTFFKVIALRDNYQPSAIVTNLFTTASFLPNTISFGFAAGEASSDFIASPGQTFYAPVTLSVLSSAVMYSLQFNLTVTNAGPNPGPTITPGAFGFQSMMMQPGIATNTTLTVYTPILPWMFAAYETGSVLPSQLVTNSAGQTFVNMAVINTNLNELALGWVERYGRTNLYNTVAQDLILYSMAHDTLFLQQNGQVIVGGYAFQVPINAVSNQTYQIQIGRPSATSDGVGASGSSVFIFAPLSGSLTNGAINSIKNVTVGQRKYLVGDVYPFRWFNAGDFGSGDLVTNGSSDVEQVFQAAVYSWNMPPSGSDFFDAMDSSGNIGTLDNDPASPYSGYYTNNNAGLTPAQLNALFNANDATINTVAFGDGQLDVCDVFVTYLRSEINGLTWYRRFWANGVRVAEATVYSPGVVSKELSSNSSKFQSAAGSSSSASSITNTPKVNFTAGDCQTNASSIIQIPITANIFGDYPLHMLMLNLSVVPLDGSPALTAPVSFVPGTALNTTFGAPVRSDNSGNGNYSAVWMPSTFPSQAPGLSNNVSIGTLYVTIPTNATSSSAYAIHFDHVSASPNGLASFPKQTLTGLITLSSRTNSSYGDGIPDSWRLRWFGTVNNSLSVSNADACGDGISNWHKYIAGTDPTDPKAYPSLNPATPLPSGSTAAIYWPTVSGKRYAIERSSSLFPGSWTAIATNTGTGAEMEFTDSASGSVHFYRVRILP